MGIEHIWNERYFDMWPVDLFAGPPNNRSLHEMVETLYEREKAKSDGEPIWNPVERMSRSIKTAERIMSLGEDFDWELYRDCQIYNLANFGQLDSKRVVLAEKTSLEEKRLWKLWMGEKENARLYLWWDKEWGDYTHKTSKRAQCRWYGANGGVVLIAGDTPSECQLYSFGCKGGYSNTNTGQCELDIHTKLGNCYNEYKCSVCGSGRRIDSSG